MSHIDPGPLATYESLADPHLTGYFNNSRMRRHLRKMGLITSKGNIVSEKVFRLNNARKEHQRHIRDVLAQAIIHKALDMERHRQMHIKKQLEEIGKIERVRRVRAERALRGDEDILPLLSPKMKHSKDRKHGKKSKGKVPILQTVTDSDDFEQQPPQSVGYPAIPSDPPYNTRTDRMTTQYPNVEVDNQHLYELDRDALRSFTLNLSQMDLGSGVSPYTVPPFEKTTGRKRERRRPATATGGRPSIKAPRPRSNARSLRLHRKEPPMLHRSQIHTLARVTFKYLGKMVHLDHEEEDPRDEVVVMQQHCGGENLRIFKQMLMKGDKFVVISRRHRTFPFSLTFYLNGVQVERLSTCCEYKHKSGVKLGARSSHFGIVKIEGSQPCFKCLISQGKLKTRPDPTPPPTGAPSRPTRAKRRRNKPRGVDERKAEEYTDDFQQSSKSSTSEDVQTDGPKLESASSSSELSDSDSSTISDLSDESDDESDSDSSTESVDSQINVKAKKTSAKRAKSPTVKKPDTPSKKKPVSPPSSLERAKSPVEKQKSLPSPVKKVSKSPDSPIQRVEKSPPSSSLSSELSTLSSSDSGDTVEEALKKETPPKKIQSDITPEKTSAPHDIIKPVTAIDELEQKPSTQVPKEKATLTKPVDIPDRPSTPIPDSRSSSSSSLSSSSSDSESSEVESVKSKSSDLEKGSKDEDQKEKKHDTSIIPLIKGKTNADLSGKKLTTSQVNELTKFFEQDPGSLTVQNLSIKHCQIGDNACKAVLKSLLRSKSLRSLDISGNKLSDDCIETVLDVCQKNPVENLDISDNNLGDSGCEELINGFTKSQATVVTAQLQKRVSQSLIASVLKDSKQELSDEHAAHMSSASSMSSLASTAVSETVFLQSLDISNTGAGHATFVSLGSYLALNPKLSHIDISRNAISLSSLESLINSLGDKTNKNLKSLHMNGAKLDSTHAEMIAEKLTEKARLETLGLKGNKITEAGKEKLEEYRKKNSFLQKLILD